MKKHTVVFSLILGFVLMGSSSYAASETYRVSVTIPAIVGMNTPPFTVDELNRYVEIREKYNNPVSTEEMKELMDASFLTSENASKNEDLMMFTENIQQNNQLVLLQTVLQK